MTTESAEPCCPLAVGHESREAAMVVIRPGVWCDPCLVPIVKALNDADIETVASCCGHGHRPGTVALADGRELVIARSFDEARMIGDLFPVDINGDIARMESSS